MQLILSDTSSFNIDIIENRVWDELKRGYKHLQHVPIQFYPWDNHLESSKLTREELTSGILISGQKLNIDVDTNKCLAGDQLYLNSLHKIYEKSYDGSREWLVFHEYIHMLEISTRIAKNKNSVLNISWREKAGLLERPFDLSLLEESTTVVRKGDVYAKWKELGKVPYAYWDNNEPHSIERILELCKPQTILRLDFCIALDDIDFLEGRQSEKFLKWWKNYEKDFCEHYSLSHWGIEQMHSVNRFGNLTDCDALVDKLEHAKPYKIKL